MKKALTTKKMSERLFIGSFIFYPLLLFAVFYVGVNFNSILMAFEFIDFEGNVTWAGFENFKLFIEQLTGENPYLKVSLINSLKMYIINLVICMPLYILFSYMLFKKCMFHKSIRFVVMIPQIISGVLMALVFTKFLDWAIPDIALQLWGEEEFPNLLKHPDYSFGTVLFYMIWSSFSTSLIVYPNAMNSIDPEIIEAGQIDGINNMFLELRYIILPLIYPTLSTFLITGFAGILSNPGPLTTFYLYDAPYETYNMGYYYFLQVVHVSNQSGYPVLAAGGLIMTILVAPLTHLFKWILDKFGPEVD